MNNGGVATSSRSSYQEPSRAKPLTQQEADHLNNAKVTMVFYNKQTGEVYGEKTTYGSRGGNYPAWVAKNCDFITEEDRPQCATLHAFVESRRCATIYKKTETYATTSRSWFKKPETYDRYDLVFWNTARDKASQLNFISQQKGMVVKDICF